jgi:tRNA(Ile)-lysidine synthetase-like protein
MDDSFANALAAIDPGRWAVGVSGGADSVALLRGLRERRGDLPIHVVHVNHQARGDASDEDERFVVTLCERLGVACTVRRADAIAATSCNWPANRSARYRAWRLTAFTQVVADHALEGVLLAHHADDLAETVLLQLRRGSGVLGLAGIRGASRVGSLRVVHPLLGVRRRTLRRFLADLDQDWREDASNRSDAFVRNRVRKLLAGRDELVRSLIDLSHAAAEAQRWLDETTPALGETFAACDLADLPDPLARHAARRWLAGAGVPDDELSDRVCGRLVAMASDASAGATQDFPAVRVTRRRKRISASPHPTPRPNPHLTPPGESLRLPPLPSS